MKSTVFCLLGFFHLISAQAACEEPPQKIRANVILNAACTYKGDYIINQSNVVFDCQGATLDGEGSRKFGIRVDSMGAPLEKVAIKNCVIKNFAINGLWIGWGKPDAEKASLGGHDDIYQRTPKSVVVDKVAIDFSGRVGLYVDDYVRDTLIKDSTVTRSAGVGVYLEHSSAGTRITDSSFFDNGSGRREQIAIDSSSRNLIENSEFNSNSTGSIFLYKNCYERAASDPSSVPRWMHSDNNIIRKNIFSGTGTAVWIASRQSRNLKGFECGDPSLRAGTFIYRDYAQHNKVLNNKFVGSGIGVNVEDNDNVVADNDFSSLDGVAVSVGAKYLAEFLGEPVTGVLVERNQYNSRAVRSVNVHSRARVQVK